MADGSSPQPLRGTHTEAHRSTPKHTETHRGTPRHTEAHRGTPRHTEAHRGTPRHTEAHRGTPRHTEAHRGTPRHTEAHRGTPRHTEAHRGTPRHTEAHRGTPRHLTQLFFCVVVFIGKEKHCLYLGREFNHGLYLSHFFLLASYYLLFVKQHTRNIYFTLWNLGEKQLVPLAIDDGI